MTLSIFRDVPREFQIFSSSAYNNLYGSLEQRLSWLRHLRSPILVAVRSLASAYSTQMQQQADTKLVEFGLDPLMEAVQCITCWGTTELGTGIALNSGAAASDSVLLERSGCGDCFWMTLQDLTAPIPDASDSCLDSLLAIVPPLLRQASSEGEDCELAGSALLALLQLFQELLSSSSLSPETVHGPDEVPVQPGLQLTLGRSVLQLFAAVQCVWGWLLGDLGVWRDSFVASAASCAPLTQQLAVVDALQSALYSSQLFALDDGPHLLDTVVDASLVAFEKHSVRGFS